MANEQPQAAPQAPRHDDGHAPTSSHSHICVGRTDRGGLVWSYWWGLESDTPHVHAEGAPIYRDPRATPPL